MGIDFGLIFFSSSEAPFSGDKYHLVVESTKFADRHGFSSVWIPERHFTKDGWLYPNPAVLQAALARETSQIHLRAGSVVMPLHNPLRVAEEWAMVDNLSAGRVGVSFASGWHPDDFALFPENYHKRSEEMYRGIEIVRKLWRGEAVRVQGGDGKMIDLKTYPTPIQPELPFWLTAAGNPKTFAGAGEIGAHLLTHMYNQSVDELAEKIRIYREARAGHGHDPATGIVSVMLHTFVSRDEETVRAQVQGPFVEYLKSASYLVNAIAYSRGQKIDMTSLSEQDLQDYLLFVFDRLVSTRRVLFGTPESLLELVSQLKAAGVDEIACQMDFGVASDLVLESLPYLHELKERSNTHLLEHYATALESKSLHGSNGNDGALYSQTHRQTMTETLTARNTVATRVANPLQELQERCRQEVSVPAFYQRLSERGIELAASFRGIKRLWRGHDEALAEIQLPAHLETEAERYQIHPTLLDACFQVIIATLPDALLANEDALYLPVGIGNFQVHKRPGKRVWSHARLQTSSAPASTTLDSYEGDVRILDEQGHLLVEASGLRLMRSIPTTQPANPAAHVPEELADWLYELRWEPLTPVTPDTTQQPGQWLIFTDQQHGVGQQLATLLTKHSSSCVSIVPGHTYKRLGQDHYQVNPSGADDMRRLIRDVLADNTLPLRGVVHMWSLDATPSTETDLASLAKDQEVGVQNALNLVQALLGITESAPPRLWLVTAGAQPTGRDTTPLAVAQAPLWGLGKTCAMEHPELWGGLIDIDPTSTANASARQMLNVITGNGHEDQVAFRQGESLAARMVRSQGLTPRPLLLHQDASYLITGGLWGLGLEVARWLVEKGARHLVLLGRTKLPARDEWAEVPAGSRQGQQIAGLRSLEKQGATVHYAPVDVADEGQLSTFLRDFQRQGYPPLKGVMHAASVWQDAQGQSLVRPLANLRSAELKTVFHPKVMGGWLLHTLFNDEKLDFFVSFSSGASLFGSAAQGNYAAAGEFLDVLAHYQRAQGQPALSIDWGAVSETGFGATPEGLRVHEYWEAHGIGRITPRQVLAALELLIPQQLARVGVIKLDWRLLQQFYPQITGMPLVSRLVPTTTDEQSPTNASEQAGSAFLHTLLDTDGEKRWQLLLAYLQEQVGGVLRIPAQRLDNEQPLTTLGLDSLMAIELKNRIERELLVRIPIVTFLQGPSITQFANQVLSQLSEVAAPALDMVIPVESAQSGHVQHAQSSNLSAHPFVDNNDQQDAEQLLAQLDGLSDQEVDALLGQMLETADDQRGNGHPAPEGEISPQDAERLLAGLDELSDEQVDSLLSHIVQKEE